MNPVFTVEGLSGDSFERKVNEMASLFMDYDINGLDVWMKLYFSDPRLMQPGLGVYKIKYMRYTLENVAELGYTLAYPHEAWFLPQEVGSDVKVFLDNGPSHMVLTRMQIIGRKSEGSAHHSGAFFPYLLDESYKTSNCPEAVFIRKEREHLTIDWKNKYQILLFESEENLCKILAERDDEDKDVAIEDEAMSTPCLLWALKGQLSEEDYQELARTKIFYGCCNRTEDLTKFLRAKGYSYRLSKTFSNVSHFGNAKDPKCVKMCYYEGHWMKNGAVCYAGHQVRINTFLERCLCRGLLKKMNAYQLACCFQNRSFAAMENVQKSINEAFENIPENTLVECPESWYESVKEKKFNPNKSFPSVVVFFDFEADTSGAYHKPFLVSACGYKLKQDGSQGECILPMTSWWGPQCAHQFMEKVYELRKNIPWKRGQAKKIRLYAHNGNKYDINFIMPYLVQNKICCRKGKIYSMSGKYYKEYNKEFKKGALCIEVWDSYLITMASLRNAAASSAKGGFLTEEQAKTIKKEAFPYSAYTYEMFAANKDPWIYPETIKEGFMEEDNEGNKFLNEEKWKEFLETLAGLPELYKEGKFHYIEYAKFYCEQDVRCLMQIMFNMEEICMGRVTDGVKGTIPFELHVWNHRTASSIGYDNMLMNTIYKRDEENPGNWVPRHDFYFLRNEGRAAVQNSVRGGRCMLGENKQQYWEQPEGSEELIFDVDANSLYPTSMCKLLWMTEGKPHLYRGSFSEKEFQGKFTHPWCPPEATDQEKEFNDGVVHITELHCHKKLCLPRLCIKDPKTKLNEWKNWDGPVNTWVNAKDLWDLIDHQDATFCWDKALVFPGKRHFEIRECMQHLYDFRADNKPLGVGNVTKLMMNSSYGKSTLKIVDEETIIVDNLDFERYFKANAYRIKSYEALFDENDKTLNPVLGRYKVVLYCKDVSSTNNMFGSDVLAGSKCVMQRPASLIEEIGRERGLYPPIYYTDTDSMHILKSTYEELKIRYQAKYGTPLEGKQTGQFHPDFDKVRGMDPLGSTMFIGNAKKVYVDRVLLPDGTEGYHPRMKGIPTCCINAPQDYLDLREGKPITKNLLGFGKVSFEIKNGVIQTRNTMKRILESKIELYEPPTKKPKEDEPEEDFTEIMSSQESFDEDTDTIVDIE